MRLLVTGGAGFIGSHITEHLIELGHQVRVLDNLSSGTWDNLATLKTTHLDCIEGDIRDFDLLESLTHGIDGIFHEAALVSVARSVESPRLSFENNAQGTLNVFEAARKAGIKRIVFASSAAVYGNEAPLPTLEASRLTPSSPYGLDKLYTEQLGALYASLYGVSSVALRYFNVYGPRQNPDSPYSGVISIFAKRLSQGSAPIIFGSGRQTRDFVFVKDVVKANLAAMFKPLPGFNIFNVGTGSSTSINQLYETLLQQLNITLRPDYQESRPGDIVHSLASIDAIRERLGYTPQWPLEKGLAELVREYANTRIPSNSPHISG